VAIRFQPNISTADSRAAAAIDSRNPGLSAISRTAAAIADGVIIGSRLIELIEEDKTLNSLKSFIVGLRQALDLEKNTGRY